MEAFPGGRVNSNFRVRTNSGEHFVVQRINRLSSKERINEQNAYASFLRSRGLTCVNFVEVKGHTVFQVAGAHWRIMREIDGSVCQKVDENRVIALSAFLARLLTISQGYQGQLPRYEETTAYHSRLVKVLRDLERTSFHEVEELTGLSPGSLLSLAELYFQNCEYALRPSHGDVNLRNFLFVKNVPWLLDFETAAELPRWYDLGDAIRSWCSIKHSTSFWTFSEPLFRCFIDGAGTDHTKDDHARQAMKAFRTMTMKLVLHFVVDYFEKTYYQFNRTSAPDRKRLSSDLIASQLALLKSAENVSG